MPTIDVASQMRSTFAFSRFAVSASSNVIFEASNVPLTTSLSHAPDASTSITTRPVSGTSVSVSVPTVPTPAG